MTQEFNDGVTYGATGKPHWNNPYSDQVDFENHRVQFFDWLAGHAVGYAEFLISPNTIPTAPVIVPQIDPITFEVIKSWA